MSQRQIVAEIAEMHRLKRIKRAAIKTQTNDDPLEFFVSLTDSKNIHVYFSSKHKSYVFSLNFSKCKKYILTPQMWVKLKKHIDLIDQAMGSERNIKRKIT